MSKSKRRPALDKPTGDEKKRDKKKKSPAEVHRGVRETIESIVIAVILAFLFRAFEAEAFVIPTGSMAPTLQGRHIDVQCDQCNLWYRTGASSENPPDNPNDDFHIRRNEPAFYGVCPVCRYFMTFHRADNGQYVGEADPNHDSFNGDRIIVSKFAYILGEPQRWDVIVFKYPGNPKQNYIKRLIGLPGEAIKIKHGDIYTKASGDAEFRIARKPPQKIKAMLQLVHDTSFTGPMLVDVGWPSRWQEWPAADRPQEWNVDLAADHSTFRIEPQAGETHWLRYRHLVPLADDWNLIDETLRSGKTLSVEDAPELGKLITDYCAYNFPTVGQWTGRHWVGDLAVECDVDVKSDSGELSLELVEGGVHFTCRIDIATGAAKLQIEPNGGGVRFTNGQPTERTGQTKLQGTGNYHLRFSNLDDELTLWIDERVVEFDGAATYGRNETKPVRPHYSEQDPDDAEPVGIGSTGAALEVTRLRVLRDVYYVASKPQVDYDYQVRFPHDVYDPERWDDPGAFVTQAEFPPVQLGEDQFFPMGDNSSSSKDARLWDGDEPFVRREFLTGKAILIYWPHSWRRPVPYWPNFKRMNFIR